MSFSDEQILKELTEIFRDVLEIDDLAINRSTRMEDIENWDSLANVRIIVDTEAAFNVRFETDDLATIDSVDALVSLIEKKLN